MGRKNILRKLSSETDFNSSDGRATMQTVLEDKKHRKDLRKYLGVRDDELSAGNIGGNFKKDLNKFLGIERHNLDNVMTNQSYRKVPNKLENPLQETVRKEGSEGYSSIDLSSSSSGSCTTSSEYYSCSHRLLK